MAKAVKKRSYSSRLRAEQSAQTRLRILESAGSLFESQGYARTTMRAIAEGAGVATDTVYAVFGAKARVLTALIDQRLAPAGETSVLNRPEAQAVRAAPDARTLVHRFAADVTEVVERVRPMYEVLRTAAAVDPELAVILVEMDGYRMAQMREVAGWLADRATLGLEFERAAEIIWTLTSPDVARMLRDSCGWSAAQHADWLEAVLTSTLLA
jgi:AcrR family transcriptional regulator